MMWHEISDGKPCPKCGERLEYLYSEVWNDGIYDRYGCSSGHRWEDCRWSVKLAAEPQPIPVRFMGWICVKDETKRLHKAWLQSCRTLQTWYVGLRLPTMAAVYVLNPSNGIHKLNPRLDLANYSQANCDADHDSGCFDWGNRQPGSIQLALALLADAMLGFLADITRGDQIALRYAADFAEQVVAHLPQDGWDMPVDKVWRWLEQRLDNR